MWTIFFNRKLIKGVKWSLIIRGYNLNFDSDKLFYYMI